MELNKLRMIGVGVIAPLIIALVGQLVVVFSLPTLPDPIATHWGPTGAADGFGSPALVLVLLPVVVLGYSSFAFFVTRSPGQGFSVNQRLMLAIAPYLATLMATLIAGSVVMQRGLTDARDAPSILPLVGLGFGLGLIAGVAGWFVLPAHSPLAELDSEDVPALELGATERATWTRTIEPARPLAILLAVLFVVLIVGGGVALWALAPLGTFVIYAVAMLVALALVASTLFWRVTVDSRGLRVRSMLGVPRVTIALDSVEKAGVVQVDPPREFGGWGVRWGGAGRLGIITRRGEALEVRRSNGKSLVVTVGGARTAAALLNSLAQRVQ